MDDHMYNSVLEYAQCELIPRFKSEYSECGSMKECKSYSEIKALCVALNAIAAYAGIERVTPSSFVS